MSPQISLVLLMISFAVTQTLECSVTNSSCKDIKTTAGYKFPHGGSGGSTIYIYHNETLIAYGQIDIQSFELGNGVLKMDKDSVITRDCQDLTVKLIVPNGRFVKEICVNFKTAASTEPETSSDTSWAFIIGVVLAVVALVCGWCVMWKKKLKKRCGRATATGLLKEVQISCCARNGTYQPNRGERDKARNHNESHPGGAGDLDTQHDNNIRNEQSSDRNPRGCGAANTERSNILERVVVQRNLGHDPGGVNSCNKEDIARDVASAWPIGAGGLDAEEHETEGRQLLLNQRAANQASDQGGEAIALVDKHSFENEPVSGCSNTLDTDVESNEELQY